MHLNGFSLCLSSDVFEQMESRRDINELRDSSINRDLRRYYALLRLAREQLRTKLSAGEIGLICDVCNGRLFEAELPESIASDVEYAILNEGFAEKWEIDGAHMIATMKSLSLAEYCALVDAGGRFWLGPYDKEYVDWGGALR